ncbi:MAG TPA: hypothetical protein VEY30_14220 [Myxococcaceae bacterium]|nr:hypothetical protein [Myxococcaceae bacterium]
MQTQPTLSSTAQVLHNLGLAAGFGGQLYGQLALHPAIKEVSSEAERGKVLNAAWYNYRPVNLATLGVTALTWVAGRSMLSGREVSKETRKLTVAKDVLMGITVASSIFNSIAGGILARQRENGAVPVYSGNEPSASTPEKAAKLQKALGIVGAIGTLSCAGVIGLTSWLNMQAAHSTRWSAISRFLP